MKRIILQKGTRFGRLIYLQDAELRILPSGSQVRFALFQCDCGNKKEINLNSVLRGLTRSCECLNMEKRSERKTHGLRNHNLYRIWRGIIDRCTLKGNQNYYLYGGRGITICNEWKSDFKSFYDWCIENGWQKDLQIDRRNNNGNYEPNNCRFVTAKENAFNRRTNRYLTANGETKTLKQWADYLNIGMPTIFRRIKRGWSEQKALTTPISQ